ncbi:MAG TPA: hypothetical protein VF746_09645 [Longimicrobium sp.]|jgi:hypothetical protein
MSKTRAAAAFTLSALLALAACEGAGEHNDPDTVQQDTGQAATTGPGAAASGTQIQAAPPPAGTVNPTPPDSNPSPTTPSPTGNDSAGGAQQP